MAVELKGKGILSQIPHLSNGNEECHNTFRIIGHATWI